MFSNKFAADEIAKNFQKQVSVNKELAAKSKVITKEAQVKPEDFLVEPAETIDVHRSDLDAKIDQVSSFAKDAPCPDCNKMHSLADDCQISTELGYGNDDPHTKEASQKLFADPEAQNFAEIAIDKIQQVYKMAQPYFKTLKKAYGKKSFNSLTPEQVTAALGEQAQVAFAKLVAPPAQEAIQIGIKATLKGTALEVAAFNKFLDKKFPDINISFSVPVTTSKADDTSYLIDQKAKYVLQELGKVASDLRSKKKGFAADMVEATAIEIKNQAVKQASDKLYVISGLKKMAAESYASGDAMTGDVISVTIENIKKSK